MHQFTVERDWEQFHDPKSLVLALVGEVGELSELFQWLPAAQAQALATTDPLRGRVAEEMSDVLLYLVRLADVLDIDLGAVARAKLASSAERFSPDEFQGVAPVKD
jgi:dCTP diphosphatase